MKLKILKELQGGNPIAIQALGVNADTTPSNDTNKKKIK